MLIFRLRQLLFIIAIQGLALSANAQALPMRVVKADLKNVKGNKVSVFKECVGAGRANEGLRACVCL